MKAIKALGIPLLFFIYLVIAAPFQSCEPDDNLDDCDTCMAYKPNIYIYPNEQIQLSVKIDFPMGGRIITSIPDYGTGWDVLVDTTGLIDNTYSYLFYESTQPDIWQKKYGWIIKTEELESFFRENMANYGFKGREIDDFIDYWIPRLDDFAFYSILPQTKPLIEGVIRLEFSMQPDNLLRLFYVVKGCNQLPEELLEPTIENFVRDGYFITEWGVILK
ncbi:MAG: hypothetical protein PHP52_06425 [Bacteroidales bacterium]|nr:hypothetical protein [Bacteroidales bacterium]MDY0142313.1 hypothetical protein [Bacteroidales bacterium]